MNSVHNSFFVRWCVFCLAVFAAIVFSSIVFSAEVDSRIYPAEVENIVDGDTMDLRIDLGFDTVSIQRVRLWGIDTPEMDTDEGVKSRGVVVAKIVNAKEVHIHPVKYEQRRDGKWRHKKGARGRYLVVVVLTDKEGVKTNLNQYLLDNKLAAEAYY